MTSVVVEEKTVQPKILSKESTPPPVFGWKRLKISKYLWMRTFKKGLNRHTHGRESCWVS